MSYSTRIGIEEIHSAYNRIKPFVHKTPVFTSATFNNIIGRNAFFKLENLQKTGSFKARGALNSVSNMFCLLWHYVFFFNHLIIIYRDNISALS